MISKRNKKDDYEDVKERIFDFTGWDWGIRKILFLSIFIFARADESDEKFPFYYDSFD